MASYNRALGTAGCENIETTLRTRRSLWAGALIRTSGGWLQKRTMSGNLEGTVHRRRGGNENESTDCVQSDIQAFGIAEDLKTTVLEA